MQPFFKARLNPKRRTRSGTAALECALILPVCITLMLGCTDFARAIHASIALCNAARVGAEYGATHRFHPDHQVDWEAEVTQTTLDEAMTIPGFSPAALQTQISTSTDATGELIITVTCHYDFQTAVAWPGLPHQLQLYGHSMMRQYM